METLIGWVSNLQHSFPRQFPSYGAHCDWIHNVLMRDHMGRIIIPVGSTFEYERVLCICVYYAFALPILFTVYTHG